jgi:GTP-binding protein EngB required for normal cell division
MTWVNRPVLRVVFVSTIKAGKSTLLNALMKHPILPMRTNRATGVVTRLNYGSPTAVALLRARSGITSHPIALDDIASYILLDLGHGGSLSPEAVEAVHVTLPMPVLHGIELVDTPGLQDTDFLTERTSTELATADLAVQVLAAQAVFSQEDRRTADRANALLGGNLVFVVNRMDQIDRDDRTDLPKWVSKRVARYGNFQVGQPRIFFTEARRALHTNDSASREDAGVAEFEQWLRALVAPPCGVNIMLHTRTHRLDQTLSHFETALQAIAEQQNTRQKAVPPLSTARWREDERALAQLRATLTTRMGTFSRQCQDAIEPLFAQDTWKAAENLTRKLEQQVAVFRNQVREETANLFPHLSDEMQFEPELPTFTFTVARSSAAAIGTGVGIVVGSLVSFGVGSAIGGVLGHKIGSQVAGDLRAQTQVSVNATIQASDEHLAAQVQQYLARLEAFFAEQRARQQSQQHTAERLASQQYAAMMEWAKDFRRQIMSIRHQEGIV